MCIYEFLESFSLQNLGLSRDYVSFVTWCVLMCVIIFEMCVNTKNVWLQISGIFFLSKLGTIEGLCLVCQVLCFHNCGLYACTYVYTKYVYIRNIIDTNIWNVFSLIVGGYRKNMLHVGTYGLFEICMYTKYA